MLRRYDNQDSETSAWLEDMNAKTFSTKKQKNDIEKKFARVKGALGL
jgi:hypothetical protein